MSTKFEDEIFLSDVVKGIDPLSHLGQLVHAVSLQTCPSTGYLDTLDPRVYLARRTSGPSHNPDSPTLYEAMNGLHAKEYLAAMQLEIETLERQHTWVSCPRPANRRVLKSTWVFKLKRLPDGTPYRYKAWFCVPGDLQIAGIDFFETYAPCGTMIYNTHFVVDSFD